MGEVVFCKLATTVLNSDIAIKIKDYFLIAKQIDIFKDFPQPQVLTVKSLLTSYIASENINSTEIKLLIFKYLFWVAVLFSVALLLVPMFLYNALLSSRKALKKCLKSSAVSFLGGIGLEWTLKNLTPFGQTFFGVIQQSPATWTL